MLVLNRLLDNPLDILVVANLGVSAEREILVVVRVACASGPAGGSLVRVHLKAIHLTMCANSAAVRACGLAVLND